MSQTIIDAITNREVLTFTYDGFPRTVEPHTYGITTAGHKAVRAYQTGGRSSTGTLGWKMFLVSGIHGLTKSGATFASARPGYKQGDSGMSKILAQL
ncbi:hypothetical protein [Thauera linaloolentis]|uniref:WYL domain-containing protein n=1 Tax=Thauera linaloolentis (strain DSM 12138 / JCM 21573 / CCUG 41526 / CIP 105981 / IAM 15112 / NBRC 102519 / 47Lol) TaxID=1123367 RepID=N6YEK0_THAL4|nr:hypothetical protein [Thauera linaloolentis]ENO89930.1 hypothetical protein C666_03555 [Thauera linaloolentis 47Lol = DSM 12138]MCM8566643.1 WYL domain-containing protein [Thauera linaloolentis]